MVGRGTVREDDEEEGRGTMQEVEEVEGREAVEASMTQMTREAWEAFCQARSMPRFSMASVVVRRPAVSMKRYVTPPMVAVSSMVSRVVPGMFVTMENLVHDIVHHNLQNRTIALMENGSWAPTAGKLMRGILSKLKDVTILNEMLTIKSSLKDDQLAALAEIADALVASMPKPRPIVNEGKQNPAALFKFQYGLFALSAREGDKDNACIINTAAQVTDTPKRISITVNKQNLTHDMILKTGVFNLSVLSQDASFAQFQQYGFRSGRDTADKFDGAEPVRTANGLRYEPAGTNAVLSGKVIQTLDCGTHTLFLAEVTEARVLSDVPSATYAYYFEHIKPKPQPAAEKKTGFVCKICGYVYEGETLPADYICPLCKHGAEDFEPLK